MKKVSLAIVLFTVYQIGCGQQTVPNSFECRLKPDYHEFTIKEISDILTKSQFENFRLLDQRVTLTFNNGFDVILLSANELKEKGLINDVTSYQSAFPSKYKLPLFHVNSLGQVGAEYPASKEVKYSGGRK